jgi:hypothetical protein
MSTIGEIQQAIMKLPLEEARQLWEWFFDYMEDELTVTDAFKTQIEEGLRDIAEGRCRIVQPPEPVLTDEFLDSGADLSRQMKNGRIVPPLDTGTQGPP